MSVLGKRVWVFFPPSTSSTFFVGFKKYGTSPLNSLSPMDLGQGVLEFFQAFLNKKLEKKKIKEKSQALPTSASALSPVTKSLPGAAT